MTLFDWPIDKPIREALGEALGAASMCWHPTPTGEFDSPLAIEVLDEVMDLIQRKQVGL